MSGSRFVRADLHVHTMLGPGEVTTATPPTVANMIGAARSSGLSVIAVTDHNTVANVDAALALASADLLVLPGIEVTAADGDVLAIFSPDDVASLKEFATEAVLKTRSIDKTGMRRSTRSVAELVREIGTRGGLAILAHVDTADGWLARSSSASKADVLADPHLVGVEITQAANSQIFSGVDGDPARRQLYVDRKKELGWKAPLARVMSSDAHSPEQVGVDASNRTLSRIRLDALDFGGVRAALQVHPDSRCRLEVELSAQYARILRAEFVGGFLAGVAVEFSPNLNTLIGGRGSGKSTALIAIQAVVDGQTEAKIDAQANMPDRTIVDFIDPLGTPRRAVRDRYGTTVEDGTSAPISLDVIRLEQNFGAELQVDPGEAPAAVMEFLNEFVVSDAESAEEDELLSRLEENGRTLRQNTGAEPKLKKATEEKERLSRMLSTASDKKLTQVAEYAAALAAEAPMIVELERQLKELPNATLPLSPDLAALAAEYDVDLTHEPASKFIPGVGGLQEAVAELETKLETTQTATQKEIANFTRPAVAVLAKWRDQHAAWEAAIAKRTAELRAAGFNMQVDQLEKIRRDLAGADAEIRTYQQADRTYRAALAGREAMLDELEALRDRRFDTKKASTKALLKAINSGSPAARVSIRWARRGLRDEFADLLGQKLGLHSPRKDRCAAAIEPRALAGMLWSGDEAALSKIGGSERFIDDSKEAMKALRTFDVLFQLETMDLMDVPEITVRFDGDPPKVARPLGQLSLGQLRSVLLGFLLRSPGDAPLLLDQPEEQLDGAFVASVVVPYLHGAKEQRQLIVATHNANIVVLGDAELVTPLRAAAGSSTVVDAGSVDNPGTQAQIVELLEGGRDAFEQRGVRYGIVSIGT